MRFAPPTTADLRTPWPRAPSARRGVVLAAASLAPERGHDAAARRVVRVAGRIARERGADLHVVHAWRLLGESVLACPVRGISPSRLRELQRGAGQVWRQRLETVCAEELPEAPAGIHVIHGDPRSIVPALARRLDAELAILGAPERGPISRLLSRSTLDHVLAGLECDVLALQPSDDVPQETERT